MPITVSCLRSGPVKGLMQDAVDVLHAVTGGVREDRRFVIVDAADRALYGANLTALAGTRATWDEASDVLELRFADDACVRAAVEEVGEPVIGRAYGERAVPGVLLGGPFAAALSERAGQPLRLIRVAPGVGAPGPLTVVGGASIARVGAELGDARFDPRRFRMTVELAGTAAYDEDGWAGARLAVGNAVLRVGGQVPRCVLTTLDPDTLIRDRDTLRAILSHRAPMAGGEPPLGVYATVEQPGRIAVGDRAEPLA